MTLPVFVAFCSSFFLIAISPGLCMTLAMSLGIRVGLRRTLWMMGGELLGIVIVAVAALAGVSALLLRAPDVLQIAKLFAAAYLTWSAYRAWMAGPVDGLQRLDATVSRAALASQGFVTAISNPKAWVFFAALLPPFIAPERPLLPQAVTLLVAMVVIEFICLLIYAQGGRVLSDALSRRGWGQWLNRISALLMVAVAIWLLVG